MVMKRAGELGMQKTLKERVGLGVTQILEYSVSRCLSIRRQEKGTKNREERI